MAIPRSTQRSSRPVWQRRGRRISQAIFLSLFFYLLLWTRQATPGLETHALFFRLDPLAGLASMVAGREWIAKMALGLLTIVLALLAGRAWCGWICPMGTLLDIVPSRRPRAGSADLPSPWRSVKYGVLTFIVIGAAAGSLTLIVLDPITLLMRSMVVVVLPIADAIINGVETALYAIEPLQAPIGSLDAFLRRSVLPVQPAFVAANTASAVVFVAVLAANAIRPRFWCRYLCPLGALLALFSRVSVLRQRVRPDACIKCGRCARVCPTGAITAERAYVADVAECTDCLDCLATCPTQAISFQPKLGPVEAQRYDPSRRHALTFLGTAVAGVGLLRVVRVLGVPDQWLLRPPGAEENSLLGKCIRCGQCLKVCPTGGLQPSLTTAGLDGLWTPILLPRHGYCDYGCNSCGQACPTGAIPSLDLGQKRQMVMGLAVIDRDRCLAWAQGQICIVCEEMCPVPDKAIRLNDITVTDGQGRTIILRRPEVYEGLCIGCGSCEYHCPIEGPAAIRVQYSPAAGQALQGGSTGGITAGDDGNDAAQSKLAAAPTATEQSAPVSQAETIPATGVILAQPQETSTLEAKMSTQTAVPSQTQLQVGNREPTVAETNRILVVYFSRTGNTRVIANQIHEGVGGDIFEVAPVDPYPSDYQECLKRARKELAENARPKLKTAVEDMKPYNVVFVGYPNWYGTIPMAMATFLSQYDLARKTIAPFCTHGGSRLGQSVTDIKALCPQSTILDGLAVPGVEVRRAQNEVFKWLRELEIVA